MFLSDCPAVFYELEQFIDHLKTCHKKEFYTCAECKASLPVKAPEKFFADHFIEHGIAEFQCLHCKFARSDMDRLHEHMCEKHCNKLLVVAARRYIRKIPTATQDSQGRITISMQKPNDIDSIILVNIGKIGEEKRPVLKFDKYGDKINFMEPSLRSYAENIIAIGYSADSIDRRLNEETLSEKLREMSTEFVSQDEYKRKFRGHK